MNKLVSQPRLEQYSNWLLANHKLIVVVIVLMMGLFIYGLTNLTSSSNLRVYFSEENPQLKVFETVEQVYTKQDNLYVFIAPKDQDVFQQETLTLVWQLTEESWQIPYSQRISSLSNFQHIDVDNDELLVDYLYENPSALSASDIARIKNIVLNEPDLVDVVISEDGKATGISIALALPENDADRQRASNEAMAYTRTLIENYREKYPNTEILLSGSVAFNVVLGEAILNDLKSLIAISLALMVIGLALFLRNVTGMAITVLLVCFASIATAGIFGWFHYALTPTSSFVPTAIMAIAIADSVHLLVTYYHELQLGKEKIAAIKESLRINASPIFITSLTTIIGVLCLNTSDSPPYRDLGNMIAVGVFFAFVLSMTFIPAILAWLPAPKIKQRRDINHPMLMFAEWVISHRKQLFFSMGIATIILLAFVPNNKLTERWYDYFSEDFEVRRAMDEVNEQLGGIHEITYNLDTGKENGIFDPTYLNTVEEFVDWYRQQPNVAYVSAITTTLKRLSKTLHGNDLDWYRMPETRELAAQYLLMYGLSLPSGLGLDNSISLSNSASRVSVMLKKMDSEDILAMDQRAQEWLENNASNILNAEGTGLDIVFSNIIKQNIYSLIIGTIIALFSICIVLMFALRSVKLGLISMVPNIVPAALAYGLWGIAVGYISMASAVVICICLGIVVDDTVHFLSKYLRARKERLLTAPDAIRYAFKTVGVALCITSVVLVVGFLVITLSDLKPSRELGALLATTIAIALAVDFLFLPPLLIKLDKTDYSKERS